MGLSSLSTYFKCFHGLRKLPTVCPNFSLLDYCPRLWSLMILIEYVFGRDLRVSLIVLD